MDITTPRVHLLASTEMDQEGLQEYLDDIGAPEWETDATSGAETLTEVAGRSCYRSFGTDLNPNVTRVREGNQPYIKNMLDVKHGSVMEHAFVTFAFTGVSRVFTHELVRHRAGSAFSQESLRFVRLDDLTAYYPKAFGREMMEALYDALPDDCHIKRDYLGEPDDPTRSGKEEWVSNKTAWLHRTFVGTFTYLETVQKSIAIELGLDHVKSFDAKKKITSAMRRLAPIGLGTAIVATFNHRAERFIISQRTSRHAEEEIRLVYGEVARKLQDKFPNLYQDMHEEMVDGFMEYTFDNEKI